VCVRLVCLFLATIFSFERLLSILGKFVGDDEKAAAIWFMVLAAEIAAPFALRRLAKKRKAKEWERAKLGLGPPTI
jgi:hypothetical protein